MSERTDLNHRTEELRRRGVITTHNRIQLLSRVRLAPEEDVRVPESALRVVPVEHRTFPHEPFADEAEREAGEASVDGFPAVAVKRGGAWIRDPKRGWGTMQVVRDLLKLGFIPARGDVDAWLEGGQGR